MVENGKITYPVKGAALIGDGADVFLSSAEIAAVASILGKIPTYEEYMKFAAQINPMADDIYRYLNFDEIEDYTQKAAEADAKLAEISVKVVNG